MPRRAVMACGSVRSVGQGAVYTKLRLFAFGVQHIGFVIVDL